MTEEQKNEYHNMVDQNIKTYGYHMTFVFDDKSPSFCYSTGIYRNFKIPELFISSLPQNLSFSLIKEYVDTFKDGDTIPLKSKIDYLTDRFPIYLIEVSNSRLFDYVLSSKRFYKGDEFKYLQLIYPDTKGYFPNQESYNYDQEIMGDFL